MEFAQIRLEPGLGLPTVPGDLADDGWPWVLTIAVAAGLIALAALVLWMRRSGRQSGYVGDMEKRPPEHPTLRRLQVAALIVAATLATLWLLYCLIQSDRSYRWAFEFGRSVGGGWSYLAAGLAFIAIALAGSLAALRAGFGLPVWPWRLGAGAAGADSARRGPSPGIITAAGVIAALVAMAAVAALLKNVRY